MPRSTVGQLIELLKQYDPDLPVFVSAEGGFNEVSTVRQEHLRATPQSLVCGWVQAAPGEVAHEVGVTVS